MSRLLLLAGLLFLAACGSGGAPRQAARPDPPPEPRIDRDRQAKAHTDLAAGYYELGNLAVALEEVRIALAADPRYAPAHNVQGLVHMELRENALAQASFERALSLDRNDPDINHNYGWFLCQTGRAAQGIGYFNNAIKNPLYRTPAKSNAQAGMCMQNAGNETEAIAYFERALRLDPTFSPAMLPYAQLLFRRGDLDGARTQITRYNELGEPSAESLWLALRVERRRGDQAAESSLSNQLRRRFPASREAQALARGQYE